MDQFSLSIVLSVGAGAGALAANVAEALALAAAHRAELEIIIAHDGGAGESAATADRLAATHSAVAVIHYPRRRGYRRTLLDAWGAARGQYIAALDLSSPARAADLARLLAPAPAYAAVLGYREPPPLGLAERSFAAAVGLRVGPGLRDPGLGLGLFRADLRELIAPEGPDALVHAELFIAAQRRGLAVTQVAVPGNVVRAPAPSFSDLAATLAHSASDAPPPEGRSRRGAAVGAGMLLAAWGVWLLRRWRRP